MSVNRDPDRLVRAWLDLMPDEAPDRTIAAVLQAVDATPQQRAPSRWPIWRPTSMNRSLVALAATTIAVILGAVVLLKPFPAQVAASPSAAVLPSIVPSAAVAPSTPPILAMATWPIGALGSWLADATPEMGLGQTDPRVALRVSGPASEIVINDFGGTTMHSVATKAAPGEVDVQSDVPGINCELGQAGTYRMVVSPDAAFLTLTAITDTCSKRAATFARTWARDFTDLRRGGREFVGTLDPTIELTLPAGAVDIGAYRSEADASWADGRELLVLKDPWGFTSPCDPEGGSPKAVPQTLDAVADYLRSIPGFTVERTDSTVDGRSAARLAVTTSPTGSCSDSATVFRSKDVTTGQVFSSPAGGAFNVWIVQAGPDTFLFQLSGPKVAPADEAGLMASVHFHDALPTTP